MKFYGFTLKIFAPLRLCAFALIFFFAANAQTLAPGAPGKDAQWATAGKQGVGTSATLRSKVWFTLAQGALTEVYYPDVTVANVHILQFVVVNSKTKKVETEQTDAVHQVKVLRPDSLTFQQVNTAKSGEWKITKTYTTDVERDTVLINVFFDTNNKDLDLYLFYDPSLGNSGMGDTAWNENETLLSQDNDKASALVIGGAFATSWGEKNKVRPEITNGFFNTNDGLTQLRNTGKINEFFGRAEKGNVAQIIQITTEKLQQRKRNEKPSGKNSQSFTVALGFGKSPEEAKNNAADSLGKTFEKARAEYEKEWADYIKTIRKVEPKYQAQFNMAAMQLKSHEDKTVRGANIASLSVPWGGGANANENNIGGYHLIWSRDLYQVATAFMALGDRDAAVRALNFLFKVQQKPDGSFPQNSYLDGKPFWGSLQLDEVAYPLILAHELGLNDKETYEKHVKRAADFIVKNGPSTPQERWEEEAGYSPSTIAAEIAGLVCAAEIARKNGDSQSAEIFLKTADEWAANVEKWTVTTTGQYSKDPYYVRITQNGKPDAGEKIELNNGAGFFDEREIVDAGFLELVRLGIKSPEDPIIQNSLKVIDQVIRVRTPNGDGFYRYNNDGYGEMDDGRRWNWDGKYTGKGRLWALLSGERGQYELAVFAFGAEKQGNKPLPRGYTKWELVKKDADRRLDAMLGFANDGLMIPEQIWDKKETPKVDTQFVPELKFGEGTGSATPLAWSMAQFIRLAVNLEEGRNLDTPKVVYDRYVLGKKSETVNSISQPNPSFSNLPVLNRFPQTLSIPEKSECERAKRYFSGGNGSLRPPEKNGDFPRLYGRKGRTWSTMIFAYVGKGKEVEIVGDFTGWKQCGYKFQDLSGSKVLIANFPHSARVEYKLIVDGKWITDPLNPNKVENGVGGENSFFTMVDYKPTMWANAEGMTKYWLRTERVDSKIYGTREIGVYVPEGFEKQELPVLYLQDGTDYQKRADAVTIQRNLVKAGKIKPFIMVFIDYKDRMKEYFASDDYAKYLATEIVPLIDTKYKTIKSRDGRGVLGASLGGITSVWVGLKYPEVFSRISGQSSSFWVDNERVVRELEKLDSNQTKFKFYFDDGTLEGVEDSRKVVEILKQKGYEVTYIEGAAGHNWTSWRDRLADAFVAFVN